MGMTTEDRSDLAESMREAGLAFAGAFTQAMHEAARQMRLFAGVLNGDGMSNADRRRLHKARAILLHRARVAERAPGWKR